MPLSKIIAFMRNSRVSFKNPTRSRIVLFDHAGSEMLEQTVLSGMPDTILCTRKEKFHITLGIMVRFLLNIGNIEVCINKQKCFRLKTYKFLKQAVRSLYDVYLLSCIQYMRPRVIITSVDNSYSFQFISRRYKEGYFIAVQNGVRCKADVRDWLPPCPEPGSTISMPILCCFGNYEIELYRKYNHVIDTFYTIGSLWAGYYKLRVGTSNQRKEFDICLISQWHSSVAKGEIFPEVNTGLKYIDDYLRRYIDDKKLRFCIALRSLDSAEEEYFSGKYGNQAYLIKADRQNMASYAAVDKSSVIVAFDSTLAREAFGWGAKVLFCNFSGDDKYTFPCPGFWSIDVADYELFRNRIGYLISLSNEEYRRQTKDIAAYVMNNNLDKPPHIFVREMIVRQLERT